MVAFVKWSSRPSCHTPRASPQSGRKAYGTCRPAWRRLRARPACPSRGRRSGAFGTPHGRRHSPLGGERDSLASHPIRWEVAVVGSIRSGLPTNLSPFATEKQPKIVGERRSDELTA